MDNTGAFTHLIAGVEKHSRSQATAALSVTLNATAQLQALPTLSPNPRPQQHTSVNGYTSAASTRCLRDATPSAPVTVHYMNALLNLRKCCRLQLNATANRSSRLQQQVATRCRSMHGDCAAGAATSCRPCRNLRKQTITCLSCHAAVCRTWRNNTMHMPGYETYRATCGKTGAEHACTVACQLPTCSNPSRCILYGRTHNTPCQLQAQCGQNATCTTTSNQTCLRAPNSTPAINSNPSAYTAAVSEAAHFTSFTASHLYTFPSTIRLVKISRHTQSSISCSPSLAE
jgi:hypothetical protein